MPEIGEVIQDYRQKAGISQQKLGEIVGVQASQQQRIAGWENGVRTPSAEYLLKLMAVLHIPPEAFDEYNEMAEPQARKDDGQEKKSNRKS